MYRAGNSVEQVFGGTVIKQGDRTPLGFNFRDENGELVNLTGTTIQVKMASNKGVVVEKQATVSDQYTVTFSLGEEDITGAGEMMIEFIVTYSSGLQEKFPSDDWQRIRITPTLENVEQYGVGYITFEKLTGELQNQFDEFTGGVDQQIDYQKKRVDNLIQSNPQPSEVIDARFDETGKNFINLKAHLDDKGKKIEETNKRISDIATVATDGSTLKSLLESGKPVLVNSVITTNLNIEVPLDIPLYLDGQGKGKVIFTGTGTFLKINRSRKGIIKNLEIEGSGQFNNQTAIIFSSPNDSNLSEGSNNVEIKNVVMTKLSVAMVLNTVYNSTIEKNRMNKVRYGLIIRGKCMENEYRGNVILASYRSVSLEKSKNSSYTANGFFPEGQYFSGGNTFDLYDDVNELEKATAATIFIESGYDIRFTANYIANLNVNYGKLIKIKLNDVQYNQCFYISFADNGLHGRDIEILDAHADALYPYNITFSDNQINFNTGKFLINKGNFVKIIGNSLKVDHDKRIADILSSNNVDFYSNTVYYGNTSNPTNLTDACVNINSSNDIDINNNDIVYAFKSFSNSIIMETNSQRVRNLNNKYKDKLNYREVDLGNGGKFYFWRQGDIVMFTLYTNTEVLTNDTEVLAYPTEFKPTNGMNWKAEFPFATGGNNRLALTNTGFKFFGTSASFLRCSGFYVSQ